MNCLLVVAMNLIYTNISQWSRKLLEQPS